MDEMRAMLDDLMGKERNLSREEREKVKPKQKRFYDRGVCKYYLCGFCPHEELRRTKNDMGDCPDIHDDVCKEEWEKLSDSEKDRYGYERDLLRKAERMLDELRKRKESNARRLQMLEKPVILAEDQAALAALTKQIDDLLSQAAKLGEEGEVDAAEAATKQAEAIKKQRALLENAAIARGSHPARNLQQQVCQVSGLIINNEESRLRDHQAGRNYNSWKKLHEVHDNLRDILAKRRESRRGGSSHHSHRDRSRSRSRDRYRRRSRSRSRSRSRDRYRRSRDYRSRDRYRDDRDDRRREYRERSRSPRDQPRRSSPERTTSPGDKERERSPGEIDP